MSHLLEVTTGDKKKIRDLDNGLYIFLAFQSYQAELTIRLRNSNIFNYVHIIKQGLNRQNLLRINLAVEKRDKFEQSLNKLINNDDK